MKKETAIEWFLNEFQKQVWFEPNSELDIWIKELIPKAKEMEKEQIIEAHGDKKKTKSNPNSIVTYGYTYTGKDYYNDKYEKL